MQNILKQFPNRRFEIERLYLESTDFRELCQDYEEVRVLVAVWKDTDDVDQDTVDAYQALLKDLETEIMDDLQARFGTADQVNPNGAQEEAETTIN